MSYTYKKSKINIFRIIWDRMLRKVRETFIAQMDSNKMDKLLELGLKAMSLLFLLCPEYRENIKGFKGKVAFNTVDGQLGATASFGRFLHLPVLRMRKTAVSNANVTITFSDGQAMASFITEPSPDIISGILDNKLNFTGNMNYILRFVFLAMDIPEVLGIRTRLPDIR